MTRVCLCLSFFLLALPAYADITGKVVGVSDGDTITVLDVDQVQHKVRLAGIDAPEKKQAFGQKSKKLYLTAPTVNRLRFRAASWIATAGS